MNSPYLYVLAKGTYPGATVHPHYGVRVLQSRTGQVPRGIDALLPHRHTWEEHIQRAINGESVHTALPGTDPELRPYQHPRVAEIAAAHAAGKPGYMLAYPPGSGKTYMAIAAMNRIAPKRVLVIALRAHCDEWRAKIVQHSTTRTEWVVINPDRLTRLFGLPGAAVPLHEIDYELRAEIAVQSGVPLERFDVVITDEAQILAHPERNRSRLWRRLVGWPVDGEHRDSDPRPTAFTLGLSATAWTTPSETSSAAHLLADAANVPCPTESVIDTNYDGWLRDRIRLTTSQNLDGDWYWADNKRDVTALTNLLFSTGMGATATKEELGLPSQNRRLHMIRLSAEDQAKYELTWTELLEVLDLLHADAINPTSGRERAQRLIQAAALIKAPYVAEVVAEHVAQGYQVVVPAWLKNTVNALSKKTNDALRRRLGERAGMSLKLTGETPEDKRANIVRTFQSGYAPVIITSTHEAISLHAGQKGAGINGEDATDKPRITIFGDLIFGGKKAFQAEGRAARDGTSAEAIYCCALGTAEQQAMRKVFRKLTNTRALSTSGDGLHNDADIASFQALADELDALGEDDYDMDDFDPSGFLR